MKKFITLLFLTALCATVVQVAYTTSNTPPPTGNTNAPGDGNCTGCHGGSGLVTSGSLWNNITLTSSVGLNSFQPNTTYTINLSFSNPASFKYGFQLLVLPSGATSASASVGTLSSSNGSVSISNSGNRSYASHTSSGTSAPTGTKTWTFNWTTPAAFNGNVTFYVVINSSDNNSSSSGDVIYAKTFGATVLPVKWLYTKVRTLADENSVEWATASEINNSHFEIEKSADLKNWINIGRVEGNGNSSEIIHYTFTDNEKQKAYYRIRQIDFDGTYAYSSVALASRETELRNIAYIPELKIIAIDNIEPVQSVQLMNQQGILLKTITGKNKVDVSDLNPGIYFVLEAAGKFQKILIY